MFCLTNPISQNTKSWEKRSFMNAQQTHQASQVTSTTSGCSYPITRALIANAFTSNSYCLLPLDGKQRRSK